MTARGGFRIGSSSPPPGVVRSEPLVPPTVHTARLGLILGVGLAAELATWFASSLGRPNERVDNPDHIRKVLFETTHRSVLIVLDEAVFTFNRVNYLIAASCEFNVPIGVLPLCADRAKANLFLKRLLARAAGRRKYSHRTALYSDFVDRWPEHFAIPGSMFGVANSADFIDCIKAGTEAAVLHSHGNGADFRIGTSVLCVQVNSAHRARGRPGEKYLPCQGGGPCRLGHKASFTAFHGPEAVRSRLLVLLSCSTHHPQDGLLDQRFLFSTALLEGEHTEGIVGSIRINFGTPELGLAVMRALDAGLTLGQIALQINKISPYGPPSYLCVGDPELSLARNTSGLSKSGHPASPGHPGRNVPQGGSVLQSDAAVPYLFAADLLTACSSRTVQKGLLALPERLRSAGLHGLGGRSFDHRLDRDLAHALADILVSAVADRDGFQPPWWRLCTTAATSDSAERCPVCARKVTQQSMRSQLYQRYHRIVRRCPQHGVLLDRPATGEWTPLRLASGREGGFDVHGTPAVGIIVVVRRSAEGAVSTVELDALQPVQSLPLSAGDCGLLVQVHDGVFAYLAVSGWPSPVEALP